MCGREWCGQMAKIGVAITQGKGGSEPLPPAVPGAGDPVSGETGAMDSTSEGGPPPIAIKPAAFKALVGRGDPEFSSARQQVTPPPSLNLVPNVDSHFCKFLHSNLAPAPCLQADHCCIALSVFVWSSTRECACIRTFPELT